MNSLKKHYNHIKSNQRVVLTSLVIKFKREPYLVVVGTKQGSTRRRKEISTKHYCIVSPVIGMLFKKHS